MVCETEIRKIAVVGLGRNWSSLPPGFVTHTHIYNYIFILINCTWKYVYVYCDAFRCVDQYLTQWMINVTLRGMR